MEEVSPDNGEDGKHRESHPTFAFFNVAELHEKLKVTFSDILLAVTDEVRSRNKTVWLKNEPRAYTLMNVSLDELSQHSEKLVQVNKFTLLSFDAIHSWKYDMITLCNLFPEWHNHQVVLGRNYRELFHRKIDKLKTQSLYSIISI